MFKAQKQKSALFRLLRAELTKSDTVTFLFGGHVIVLLFSVYLLIDAQARGGGISELNESYEVDEQKILVDKCSFRLTEVSPPGCFNCY